MKCLMPWTTTTLLRILTIVLLVGPWPAALGAVSDGPKSVWPPGTVTNGSTTHPALVTGGGIFYSSYAIDGDIATFWNDNTPLVLPDSLIIKVPSPITLDGIILLSSSTNWILDYTVETLSGANWVLQAKITDCESALRYVPFKSAVKTTQLRIEVTKNQDDYTRINEVYPVFAASASTTNTSESDPTSSSSDTDETTTRPTSSTADISGDDVDSNSDSFLSSPSPNPSPSPSPSPSTSPKSSSNTVAIVGGVLGAVVGILCIALVALFAYLLRRKRKTPKTFSSHSQSHSPPPNHHHHQSEPEMSMFLPPAELSSSHRFGIPGGGPAYQNPELEAR